MLKLVNDDSSVMLDRKGRLAAPGEIGDWLCVDAVTFASAIAPTL
jgi:hypothetical protein